MKIKKSVVFIGIRQILNYNFKEFENKFDLRKILIIGKKNSLNINTFTFEEVCDWADELTIEDITKIRDVFEQTQSFKNLIKTAQEPLTKKKPKSNKEKV